MVEPVSSIPEYSREEIRTSVERDGFCLVPGILNDELCRSLCAALTSASGAEPRRPFPLYAMRNLLSEVPLIGELARSHQIASLAAAVLGDGCFPVRATLFDKLPGANWKVTWHQDLSIAVRCREETAGFGPWSVKAGVIHVQPPAGILERMLAVRLHLDDCPESNGPLRVIPGSHMSGRLGAVEVQQWRSRVSPAVCTAPRGSALLLRPLLLHASSAASVPGRRRVIHLEFAAEELPGRLEWAEDG